MELETTPQQPEEVLAAIAELLAEAPAAPDPWWRAGARDDLET